MWAPLHRGAGRCVVDRIVKEVTELRQTQALPKLVICGHSLGAGYAVLSALHLFTSTDLDVTAVIAHGCPQVIVPPASYDHPMWHRLHAVVKVYVNQWDVVPRLPSCGKWLHDVLLDEDGNPHPNPHPHRGRNREPSP